MLQGIIHEAGNRHRAMESAMGKPLIMFAIMSFTLACGPEGGDEDDGPGKLEYEDSYTRLYRLDRRVDVTYEREREDGVQRVCGFLTDRAYDDLKGTLASLDPNVDYGGHPVDCMPDEALVHVESFEHSPFECSYECCHPDLFWAALVYTMVLKNFDGIHPTIGITGGEGEPYVAIEPDQPCP